MSENLMTFEKMVRENPELLSRVMELKKLPPKEAQEAIAAIAGELGIALSEDNFTQMNGAMIEGEELSDLQMENVSGGSFGLGADADDGHERDCVFYYYTRLSCCQECGCLNPDKKYGIYAGIRIVDVTCTRCKITKRYTY